MTWQRFPRNAPVTRDSVNKRQLWGALNIFVLAWKAAEKTVCIFYQIYCSWSISLPSDLALPSDNFLSHTYPAWHMMWRQPFKWWAHIRYIWNNTHEIGSLWCLFAVIYPMINLYHSGILRRHRGNDTTIPVPVISPWKTLVNKSHGPTKDKW